MRYSLCGKLKLPVRHQRCCVVNIPRYCMRKLCFNETVRWTSTKANVKQTKKLFSQSKILRLYSLAKPEKNRLLCKLRVDISHATSGFHWFFFRVSGAVCFLLVSSAITMVIPFSFGRVVDIIYKSDLGEVQSKLITICTILLPIFLIGAACNFGRIYIINTSGSWIFYFIYYIYYSLHGTGKREGLNCLLPEEGTRRPKLPNTSNWRSGLTEVSRSATPCLYLVV